MVVSSCCYVKSSRLVTVAAVVVESGVQTKNNVISVIGTFDTLSGPC